MAVAAAVAAVVAVAAAVGAVVAAAAAAADRDETAGAAATSVLARTSLPSLSSKEEARLAAADAVVAAPGGR